MILNFLRTKIGVSIVAALVIIGLAAVIKTRSAVANPNLSLQIGLIADASVKQAVKNGATTNLDAIIGTTTTIDETIAKLQADSTSTVENTTATDRFAQQFFTQYMQLKSSGQTIDQSTASNITNQLLSQDYGSPDSQKIYTQSDISVIDTTSLSAIKIYANKLGAIIQQPLPQGYESELSIVAQVHDTGNDSELSKLSANIDHYKWLLDHILALPVPYPLVNPHLALLNSLSAVLTGVKGMADIKTDPVGATKMIQSYQTGIESISLPLEEIRAYLKKQNISFSSSESGYVLIQ